MKKPRHQPALASLTLAEREQLADWLRHEHYQAVLARVNKPRPEGFGLRISEKPLRTFWMKVGMLDAINAKLSPDKKIPLAIFEKLASRDYYLLTSSENKTVAEAHAKIIRTTADLAASGDNSPHQLLVLQRLADFPARAEIRENHEQLNREKWAHKLDMDNFRKHIATERLELAKKSFALREQIAQARLQSLDPNPYPYVPEEANQWWGEGAPEPTSTSRTDTTPTTAAPADQKPLNEFPPFPPVQNPIAQPSANTIPFNQNHGRGSFHPSPTSISRADMGTTTAAPADQKSSPQTFSPSPFSLFPPVQNPFRSSLPPEVLANNALYEHKVFIGEIKEISAPGELARVDYSNPADRDYFSTREHSGTARFVPDPTRTDWLPGLRSFGPGTAPSPQNPNTSSQPTPSALVPISIQTQHSPLETHHSTFPSVPSVPLWLNQSSPSSPCGQGAPGPTTTSRDAATPADPTCCSHSSL